MPPLATRHSPLATLKSQLGCWIHERWRTELALARRQSQSWLDLCNRHETLSLDPISGGRICKWQHSSQLTVSRVFPDVGTRLLSHCLRQWPIKLQDSMPERLSAAPEVSVLIAIGGTDRIHQFRIVLKSLLGQSHRSMEIIVVEQSHIAELETMIPSPVRYFHSKADVGAAFNKSQALNTAARNARGKYLVIHDADFVVPCNYLYECCRVLEVTDAARPTRFIFNLNRESTLSVIAGKRSIDDSQIEAIFQNTPNPICIRKDVYWEIGGNDERFVGWGGEDVEFLSRLRTRNVSEGGWLPIVHLWHPAAPKKASGERNQQLQDARLKVPASDRISTLIARQLQNNDLSDQNT
jgi:hypothetical protein